MSVPSYPDRPPFFALKFIRLIGKICLANEIGADACWLLTTIASVEDAKSYRSAVTFFNEQLMPLVGQNSHDSLARVRAKAVKAGWLHYEKGGKGFAGKYWVVVPTEFTELDDGPADENPSEYTANVSAKLRTQAGRKPSATANVSAKLRTQAGRKPSASAYHSSLSFPLKEVDSFELESEAAPASKPDTLIERPQDEAKTKSATNKKPKDPNPAPPPGTALSFPTVGDVKVWHLTESQLAEWKQAYPKTDLLVECRKALVWVNANRKKIKTSRGMPAFLAGWFNRAEQFGASRTQSNPPSKPTKYFGDGEYQPAKAER